MSQKPLFSIVVIAKNEATTLPKLVSSLREFQSLGGEICVLDTGSTDGTASIARKLLCKVEEVGEKYIFTIDGPTAEAINERFIVEEEEPIVKKEDKFFNYSEARNHAASIASNDIIFCYDADEMNANLNIPLINNLIKKGTQQFEYNFVFAKDVWGNEAVKFIQSKAYDRRVMHWQGIIHELLCPKEEIEHVQRTLLEEKDYKLEHHQNTDTKRHSYLKGLALDCFNHPDNDRHSHYLARELFWNKRYQSAIREFKRHIDMNKWPQERAQSAIFIGDCYGALQNPSQQAGWYSRAFYIDSSRRESLIKLALFYRSNNQHLAALCYATAAMEIPYNGYYANNMGDYTNVPHEIIYSAKGWLGDIEGAQKHLLKALEYQPYNTAYLRDTKYYFEYYDQGIEGWMLFEELQWLYNTAKSYKNIIEIGSWKGRSTHALLSGNSKVEGGTVTAIDTWEGSVFEKDDTHWLAKQEDVFQTFKNNVGAFKNLSILRGTGNEGALKIPDKSADVTFIDAGHRKEDVLEDIYTWLPKTKTIICGHDYKPDIWMGVVEAVNEVFGKPDGVAGTIWWVDLSKREYIIPGRVKIEKTKKTKKQNEN